MPGAEKASQAEANKNVSGEGNHPEAPENEAQEEQWKSYHEGQRLAQRNPPQQEFFPEDSVRVADAHGGIHHCKVHHARLNNGEWEYQLIKITIQGSHWYRDGQYIVESELVQGVPG